MKSIFFAGVFILLAQSLSYAQPVARFAQVDHDFGSVSERDKVEHVFELANAGDDDLLIEKVVASSGNTKAVSSANYLKPGEKGNVRVIIDMRGKKGIFIKTIEVYTNDPITPVATLTLKVSVKDQIHMSQYKANEIFSENCRGCHVDQGKGKKGWDLFKADCFMCHNAGKKSSLSSMSRKPTKEMVKALREGVENSLMPGFDQKNGGPLDDAEIKSLIDLISR
jgi:cytochrome c553